MSILTCERWLEMYEDLRKAGYSEPEIAAFNRVSMIELRVLRAHKIKVAAVSAEDTPPIIEEAETNE